MAALAAVDGAIRRWYAVEQRCSLLLRPVQGIDGRDIPMLGADGLRSEIDRLATQGVPAPLPRSLVESDGDLPEAA